MGDEIAERILGEYTRGARNSVAGFAEFGMIWEDFRTF